jgi:hypothetical protein
MSRTSEAGKSSVARYRDVYASLRDGRRDAARFEGLRWSGRLPPPSGGMANQTAPARGAPVRRRRWR